MTDLLYYQLDADTSIAVEVDENEQGFEEASPRVAEWSREHFGAALARARHAGEQALEQFREMTIRPDEITIELGIKMSAEAGAVIARTIAEGHLKVTLNWRPQAD